MAEVHRLSSSQRYGLASDGVLRNQDQVLQDTMRMNTGKRRLNLYDDPLASIRSYNYESKISRNEHYQQIRNIALTELEVAETALTEVSGILETLKADSVRGANGTLGPDERETYAQQVRELGLNIVQLLNSKVGNKYIFSGKDTDKKTLLLEENSNFSSASFKEGALTDGMREVANITSSVDLETLLTVDGAAASVTASNANPTVSGDIKITVDDGNGNIISTGNLSFAGDNIATVVGDINTAFTTAGGSGAIASSSAGKLVLNTDLITSDSKNKNARITLTEGDSPGTALTNLGLSEGTWRGTSINLMDTLSKLEAAYKLNDSSGILAAQADLTANIDRITGVRTEIGHLEKRVEARLDLEDQERVDMKELQSDLDDIPVTEALQAITKAQTVLNGTVETASMLFRNNIFDFIN